jgi:hypothetical protein
MFLLIFHIFKFAPMKQYLLAKIRCSMQRAVKINLRSEDEVEKNPHRIRQPP